MAAPKTLKSRIEALINAIGGKEKPTLPKIRNELVAFALSAEALENGEATREAEAQITALEAALEQSEAAREESNAELGQLKGELQTANAEIKRFQAEQKKRNEKEREMPPIQFQILSLLPSQHSGKPLKVEAIAQAVSIPVDEADVHINKLKKAGLVIAQYNNFAPTVWHRSNAGNELVLARRLAGEEEATKPHKYANLPKIQHEALLLMVGEDDGIFEKEIAEKLGQTFPLTRYHLNLLRKAEMATDGDEPDYGAGRSWDILEKGADYLAERDLL